MATSTKGMELLREVEYFACLDEATLCLIGDNLRVESYAAGEIICEEGAPADWMFVVSSGEVGVLKHHEDGSRIQIAVLERGDFGGMQSVFERKPRSATLVARGDVKLWILDHDTFQRLIESNSGVAMGMLAFMSGRMRRDSANLAMTLHYVDSEGLREVYEECAPNERLILDTIVGKVLAAESLDAVMNFLFDSLRKLSPCNRLDLAFLEEDQSRVVSYWLQTDYEPVLLTKGFTSDVQGAALEEMLQDGRPLVINDLGQYTTNHPDRPMAQLMVQEGLRCSMMCPLVTDGRPIGMLSRSSRTPNAYDDHQVRLHLAIAERLSQAVEKAYRIEQLTSANQAYFEMLGFVSHELKSPLASVVMNTNVILQGYLGEIQPKQRDQLEKVIRKSEYLLGLVGEYLNLSRLESGELRPEFRANVNLLDEIIDVAVDTVSPQADQKAMHLERDWSKSPIVLDCAPDLLQIVMVNLLSNAVKYGREEGNVRLTIRETDERVSVTVWNEGPGFPEEERSRLFRKFSRIQTPELMKQKGTGVGLYTTWRIIQSHRGRIEARSKHGEWAEFAFEIPKVRDAGAPAS